MTNFFDLANVLLIVETNNNPSDKLLTPRDVDGDGNAVLTRSQTTRNHLNLPIVKDSKRKGIRDVCAIETVDDKRIESSKRNTVHGNIFHSDIGREIDGMSNVIMIEHRDCLATIKGDGYVSEGNHLTIR